MHPAREFIDHHTRKLGNSIITGPSGRGLGDILTMDVVEVGRATKEFARNTKARRAGVVAGALAPMVGWGGYALYDGEPLSNALVIGLFLGTHPIVGGLAAMITVPIGYAIGDVIDYSRGDRSADRWYRFTSS